MIYDNKNKFPNAKPTIWIEVMDVIEIYNELKSKGVLFTTDPFTIRTGWAVEFTDPSGNRLRLADYKK